MIYTHELVSDWKNKSQLLDDGINETYFSSISLGKFQLSRSTECRTSHQQTLEMGRDLFRTDGDI